MATEIIKLQVTCKLCKHTYTVLVEADGYKRWKQGELIQRALPNVSADACELLKSRICGTCFDKLFNDDSL